MRLRAKLILVCSLAITLISVATGGLLAYSTWTTALERIDANLDALATSSRGSKDPVGEALLNLDSATTQTQLEFYSIDKDFTVLGEVDSVIVKNPSLNELRAAATRARTVEQPGTESFRLRTVSLDDDEYLVFASSLGQARVDTTSAVVIVAGLTFSSAGLAALVIWLITRRDLKRIEALINQAQQISAGDFAVELEPMRGTSEIEQLNNALAQMVKSLKGAVELEKQVQKKMRNFLADASHELKTPLTVIRGYFELIRTQSSDDEMTKRGKSRIDDQIKRMQSLVDDLLLLAELESRIPEEFELVDFSKLVALAVDDLKALDARRSIQASIEPGLFVLGSKGLLEQLLANLISNINRYVPNDAEVAFGLERTADRVVLAVDDGGPGLPESAYQDGVQHFERFDPSRSRESGGSGLGISIMNAIVEQHHGELQLDRSSLGGLRTIVRLPESKDDSQRLKKLLT